MTVATYKSNMVKKGVRMRPHYSGQSDNFKGRILVPSGTVLAINDVLLFVPLGENQCVTAVDILTVGDCGTAAGSVGYFQILDSAGNPVVVQRIGPNGGSSTKYTSPATAATAFHAAEALAGYTLTQVAAPTKLTGPVNMGIKISTAGTMTGDVEFFGGCVVMAETSTNEVTGTQAPSGTVNDYLL